MTPFLRTMLVVARRDFLSIVATPTFLLFLLAPLFMMSMGLVGGMGASQMADSARSAGRLVAVATAADAAALRAADARLRKAIGSDGPAMLVVIESDETGDESAARAPFRDASSDTFAVMVGPLARPLIVERDADGRAGRYLHLLAEQALRDATLGAASVQTQPRFVKLGNRPPSNAARQALGFGAVFIIFLLTLLLAGQSVGMLAEEKGNKVIEILTAAAPLESVFLGKLLGLLGVAVLFITFWTGVAVIAGVAMAGSFITPETVAAAAASAKPAAPMLAPATGWGFFLGIGFAYFVMAFLLLGAIFLGVGAQAGTVREIQMLSLPITIFQVGMFGLSSTAANVPGTKLARMAEAFPFSSPFAMAARAATDSDRWIHLAALAWQAMWVAIVVAVAARLFRSGVIGGRTSWAFWRTRRTARH